MRGSQPGASSRRDLAAALAALVAIAAACRGAPRDLDVAARLSDRIAEAPAGASPGRCAVADEIRPALGCVERQEIASATLPRDARGAFSWAGPIPPGLRGRPLAAQARVTTILREPVAGASDFLDPDATGLSFDLPLPETPSAIGLMLRVEASAVPPPVQRWRTEPLAIARGAELAVGLGFDEGVSGAGASPVEFAITAELPSGESELLREVVDPAAEAPAWRDRRVRLDAVARAAGGAPVRLAFATRVVPRDDAAGPAFAAPLWGSPLLLEPGRGGRRRNVVLISLDTLRGDFVGATSGGDPLTPHLDRIRARGATFLAASATFPSTTASHMSLLTGLYPAVHRVGVGDRRLRPAIPTLAEMLARDGWATAAFTEDAMLIADAGFSRGFDAYGEQKGATLLDTRGDIEKTFAAGLRWLAHHPRERFFLFLHTYQVHEPYTPPPEYAPAGDADDAGGCQPEDARRAEHARDRALYSGEVRYADAVVGRLYDELARRGDLDDTVFLFTSDHGEEFGEHGGRSHSRTVYEELLHVPLAIVAPGLVASGLRVDTPVSLVDVVPTVLALAGARQPEGVSRNGLAPEGVSRNGLAPEGVSPNGLALDGLLRGDPFPHDRALFAEKGPLSDRQRLVAARSGARKWIFRGDADEPAETYDLAEDPCERRALDDPAALDPGRPLHARHRALRDAAARAAALPGDAAAVPRDVDDATARKLRALGYLPGD